MGNWVNGDTCHSLKYRKLQVEQAMCVRGGGGCGLKSVVSTLQLMSCGQSLSRDVLQSVEFVYNQSLMRYTGL